MNTEIQDDPWGEFWKRNAAAGARGMANGEGGGCLPQRWAAIENGQKSAWHDFVEGLTDELITFLAKLKGLRVISRQSVMRYRNSELPLAGRLC